MNMYSDEGSGWLALVFELMDINLYDYIKGKKYIIKIRPLIGYAYKES
jgi:hypothetical protein